MTALDLLFVLGQALMLLSFVYFLRLFIWWRSTRPADLETAERRSELRQSEDPRIAPTATHVTESPRSREIAHA